MKKYFLRYFVCIFSIALMMVALQSGFLLLQYKAGRDAWRQDIYESCIDELEYNIKSSYFPDLKINGMNLFSSIAQDNRISGYMVRDSEGNVVLTVGQTPDGRVLASYLRKDEKIQGGTEVKSKQRSTTLHADIGAEIGKFAIKRDKTVISKRKTTVPDFINANDIIGSITVAYADSPIFTVDILIYSPRTYRYSKQIINPVLKSLAVSLPLCLIIAFIGALVVSSKNTKFIREVSTALKDLADGRENVEVPKNKNSELNDITLAIHELDAALQGNRKSRNAWLGSISHDLNTPATAMKIIVDGMNEGIFKPSKETLKELQIENDNLVQRIERVIEYSSLIAETKPQIEEVSTETLTEELSQKYPIYTEIKTENIKCNGHLIKRALTELLDNAVQALPKTATDTETKTEEQIKLIIEDDGNNYIVKVINKTNSATEIADDMFFEPWVRGDKSRTSGGNGLGLPIVAAIVSLHKGKADIKQENGSVTASLCWTKNLH